MGKIRFVVTTNRPVNISALAQKVGKDEKDVRASVPKMGDPRPIVTIRGAGAEELFIAVEFFDGGVEEIDFTIED